MLTRTVKSGKPSLDALLDQLQEPDPELRDTAQNALFKFVNLLSGVMPQDLLVEPIIVEDP